MKARIVVGEGSCGLAAGAGAVYSALEAKLTADIAAELSITGCVGICYLEPIVDVYDENGDDSLGDIKCTSKVHIPNVTLQLSIYAWLYEMQNPTRKVKNLYCVWLPRPQYGQPDIFLLDRVPSEVCEKIVTDYIKGESNEVSLLLLKKSGFEHEDERKRVEGEVPEAVQELIDELEERCGRTIIGNKSASGTEILDELAEKL